MASTRTTIIQKADDLFYEQGFGATSFADIASAVGISRGNFYHHFKTKDDILDAVITRRLAKTREMLDGWARRSREPQDRIAAFVRILIVNQTKIMAFGCPVGSLNSELSKLDHQARDRAAEIFTLFKDWLAGEFRELGRPDQAQDLALHTLARSQGIATLAQTFGDAAFVRSEVDNLLRWVKDIAPPKPPPNH